MISVDRLCDDHGTLLQKARPLSSEATGIGEIVQFREELSAHFSLEEAEVFPNAQKAGWTGGTVVYEFRHQHHALLELLNTACDESAGGRGKLLDNFVRQLEEHFGGEEDILFPLVGVAQGLEETEDSGD